MSYNTRRGGHANSASSVGQRRPMPGTPHPGGPFNQGGPNTPNPLQQQNQQQGPNRQQPQQQHQPQKLQPPPVQRQQQQPILSQQSQRPQQQQTPIQQQQSPAPQQQQPPVQQQVKQEQVINTPQKQSEFETEPSPTKMEDEEGNTNGNDVEGSEDGKGKRFRRRPFWMTRIPGTGTGKVDKREQTRRRNEILRRRLRPKNAVMVLNELVGGNGFTFAETDDCFDGSLYKCTVTINGKNYGGVGKTKMAAKCSAAEAALKATVLTKYKPSELRNSGPPAAAATPAAEGEEKMEVTEETGDTGGLLWSHVVSYALHKLLNEWDEDGAHFSDLMLSPQANAPKLHEKKAAKKLPETASTMNPVMLLNQMCPNSVYEELSRIGNPPHVKFTVQCTVNDKAFQGTGSTKKAARKICAFNACIKALGIEYAQTFLEENNVTFDGDGNAVYAEAPAVPVA